MWTVVDLYWYFTAVLGENRMIFHRVRIMFLYMLTDAAAAEPTNSAVTLWHHQSTRSIGNAESHHDDDVDIPQVSCSSRSLCGSFLPGRRPVSWTQLLTTAPYNASESSYHYHLVEAEANDKIRKFHYQHPTTFQYPTPTMAFNHFIRRLCLSKIKFLDQVLSVYTMACIQHKVKSLNGIVPRCIGALC